MNPRENIPLLETKTPNSTELQNVAIGSTESQCVHENYGMWEHSCFCYVNPDLWVLPTGNKMSLIQCVFCIRKDDISPCLLLPPNGYFMYVVNRPSQCYSGRKLLGSVNMTS